MKPRTLVYLISAIIIFASRLTNAQFETTYENKYVSNVIFAEAAGNGIFASINYEKFISRNSGIRIGLGNGIVLGVSVPVMFNYYPGEGNNRLELGGGLIYLYGKLDNSFFQNSDALLIGATIGIRHQKATKGIVIRINFTPFYNPKSNHFLPYGGISIGYAF